MIDYNTIIGPSEEIQEMYRLQRIAGIIK